MASVNHFLRVAITLSWMIAGMLPVPLPAFMLASNVTCNKNHDTIRSWKIKADAEEHLFYNLTAK